MEKTNTNKTSEAFDEASRMTNKWMAETCSTVADFYEKQFKNVWDAYSRFFDYTSGTERNGHTPIGYFSPFLFGNNFFKTMVNPFNIWRPDLGFSALSGNHLEEMNKQLREFNNRILNLFSEQIKNNSLTWDDFNKLANEEWKAAQNRLNSLQETYMKRLQSSIEFNKKLAQEISAGYETAVAANKKMWDDLMKKPENHEKTEKEHDRKDWPSKKHAKTELAYH